MTSVTVHGRDLRTKDDGRLVATFINYAEAWQVARLVNADIESQPAVNCPGCNAPPSIGCTCGDVFGASPARSEQ